MEGYKKVVLLRHKTKFGPFTLSAAAEKKANIVATPTKANLLKYLKQLASEGYSIDVFIFSHGSKRSFRVSTGTYGKNASFRNAHITRELTKAKTGCKKFPIRLVYQVNCFGSTMNAAWAKVGAKAVVGARDVNFFPSRYGRFIKEWNKGKSVQTALSAAKKGLPTAVHAYILGDAKVKSCTKKKKKNGTPCWGACPFPKQVTGSHSCAKDYFTWKKWAGAWLNGTSGAKHLVYSSEKLRKGSNITKNSKLTW